MGRDAGLWAARIPERVRRTAFPCSHASGNRTLCDADHSEIPPQEFPYQQINEERSRPMPSLQIAAEVLKVSAVPLAIALMVLIAFELVLIG